jgi:dinuclear metal center YbgI/SA1388 family protein
MANNTVSRTRLTAYLDGLFDGIIADDSTVNGLQIEGAEEIGTVGFSVDSSLEVFEAAAERGCQFLVTHHGLIWGGLKKVTGNDYRRLKTLFDHHINLYVRHLPLDIHPEFGNNAGIIRALGALPKEQFADYGYFAEFPKAIPSGDFIGLVRDQISPMPVSMDFGPPEIRRIAVCSGSLRPSAISEAVDGGAQALLTGEGSSSSLFYYPARESGIHVIFAGHYATEIFGVRSLCAKAAEKFKDLNTVLIEMPTGW